MTIHFGCSDIPFDMETRPVCKIRRLNLTEVCKISSYPKLLRDLLPEKYFSADYGSWLPMVTNESNLRLVAMQRDVTASFARDGLTCCSLAFRTVYQLLPSGFRVLLWCYGNKLTPAMVIAHAHYCLQNLSCLPPFCDACVVSVGIMFPLHVDKQEVAQYFAQRGYPPQAEADECAIIEQKLYHNSASINANI